MSSNIKCYNSLFDTELEIVLNLYYACALNIFTSFNQWDTTS